MQESYQFGPIAISKSFVKKPYFLPGVVIVALVVILLIANSAGLLSRVKGPSLKAQIFPLNQQLSKPVLYSAGTTIYRTTGQSEQKLYEVGNEVITLVPSSDGSHLAATYKFANGGSNAYGNPATSLIWWDMNTGKSLPVIAQQNTTVRYPQWSDDGKYLAFWLNEGDESFVYDTARRKAIFSVKKDGSIAVSPIVFLPGNSGIAYIKNGTLYSDAADGTRAIALATDVASTRTINNAVIAAPPVASPNGAYLVVYNTNGDLAVVNTATREEKIIASGATSLGFLSNDDILYSGSNDKAPVLYRFTISSDESNRLMQGTWPQSAVALNSQNVFYMPVGNADVGPQRFTKDGAVEKDCSLADFHYDYMNSGSDSRLPQTLQVVSTDGRYLLGSSAGSLAVMDTATCQPYIISQSHPTAMTWLP